MWGTVSCLRRQHNDRDWALNHQSLDLKSHVLTTSPPRPLLHVSEQKKKQPYQQREQPDQLWQ